MQIITIIMLATWQASGAAAEPSTECAEVKERIRYIQSRMRSGYTRAQGERLEAELRRLRERRRKACR
jgi:hypothetical protein